MTDCVSKAVDVVHCNHKCDSLVWSPLAHGPVKNKHFNCQIDVPFVSVFEHVNAMVKSLVDNARNLSFLLHFHTVILPFESADNWHAIVVRVLSLFKWFPG